MLYVAVSIAHGCSYCIHSHTASTRAKGVTDQEFAEMIAIVGMAAETNRLVTALGVDVDEAFLVGSTRSSDALTKPLARPPRPSGPVSTGGAPLTVVPNATAR
jgi:AhpD family alkylhydroperoxidase